jgi:large subunit ribosomal protein L25
MAAIFMEAEPRTDVGKGPNRRLRASGRIPGVLYGGAKETVALSLDPKAIVGIIRSHGGVNTIFELGVKGAKGKENVMIREYQIEPVEHRLLHADLVRVAWTRSSRSTSPSSSPAPPSSQASGAMMDFVTAQSRSPAQRTFRDHRGHVSHLELGQYIRASELKLPPGVKLVSDANIVIAHCVAPKAEEEEKPAEAVAVEGAEGAAPAEGAAKAEAPKEGKDKPKEGKDKPKEGKGKD